MHTEAQAGLTVAQANTSPALTLLPSKLYLFLLMVPEHEVSMEGQQARARGTHSRDWYPCSQLCPCPSCGTYTSGLV